jgi:catechol 2,3-dioxygenase-like lactoylglutathione lyase family enzyme
MTANVATQAVLKSISPFLIVRDLARAVAFYRDRLGFDVRFQAPDSAPFFAIIGRDGVQLMLKVIDDNVGPLLQHIDR